MDLENNEPAPWQPEEEALVGQDCHCWMCGEDNRPHGHVGWGKGSIAECYQCAQDMVGIWHKAYAARIARGESPYGKRSFEARESRL